MWPKRRRAEKYARIQAPGRRLGGAFVAVLPNTEDAIALAKGRIQETPEPHDEHRYGRNRTLLRSGTIDIQTDPDGNILRVWFRCLSLPFTVSTVDDHEVHNPCDSVAIEEIVYRETS